jgi:cob(I)alamin adenosyltransferase
MSLNRDDSRGFRPKQLVSNMPKIYTRTGDDGETGLFGGDRVRKDTLRVDAMGTVDELNAALGAVRAELGRGGTAPPDLDELLAGLQNQLFDLGAELATPESSGVATCRIADGHITQLESAIDRHEAGLEPLRAFILPGGTPAAAALHVARGVCRQAERRLVALMSRETIRGELVRYLNRLGDLLFVLARSVNRANRVPDVVWRQQA